MSTVTLPQARIPLGWVTVKGSDKPSPVTIDIEWMRAFVALLARVGGISGQTIDIQALIAAINAKPALFGDDEGDGWSMPGPAGPAGSQGAPGATTWGEQGEQGDPGLMFWQPAPYRTHLNATASRALNTTYTNVSTSLLMVHVTARCTITLGGGNAYVQALMDTASPPTVVACGKVGIEAGLLGEDNTFQAVFFVNPGGTYRVNSAATNGTVTLGTWMELPL